MTPKPPVAVQPIELKECFADPLLDMMTFLNEVVLDYPDAVSFAPGRPLEALFDVESHVAGIAGFVGARAARDGTTRERQWRDLGQYNRTRGIITEDIARHLRHDEGIDVSPEAIIVTVGAQEAMAIILAGLFQPGRDILLVSDPTYIGITGLARILGIRTIPVAAGDAGVEADAVEAAIVQASSSGRVRAFYDIPDFNNPLGTSLSVRERTRLLEVCARHHVLAIEDNPYGMFVYDGERQPPLKALDRTGTVLYVGSFAKTIFPSLRVGYLVADQRVAETGTLLAAELSRVKSLLTVNTSTLSQAIVGQALVAAGGSIEPLVEPKRAQFRRNRDTLVAALTEVFSGCPGVSWNVPSGGFFMTVTLPFEFGTRELHECAEHYGVVVCPMQCFSLRQDRACQIRLSFSYVEPPGIQLGASRLARFVQDRIEHGRV
jgi:(S)-3,5-dihydroxyphenylglycine transaminase